MFLTALPLSLALLLPSPPQTNPGDARELAGIREEQDLLRRKVQRLEETMEKLLPRTEAEGRERTSELLRAGLEELRTRAIPQAGDTGETLEESMARSGDALEEGRLNQAVEAQRQVVERLETLLATLLDRQDLDEIEQQIAELRQLQRSMAELADRENLLREETRALRESASNDAQRELEAGIQGLLEAERALLNENERLGRDAGTLELEQLEREINRLLEDQRVDTELLESWSPREPSELAAAREPLARAVAAESHGARLEDAAGELERAAQELESGAAETDVQERLTRAAERAKRHERVASDPAARAAAEALTQGEEAVEQVQSGEATREDAARTMRELAKGLRRSAAQARVPAQEERARAEAELEALSERSTPGGSTAQAVRSALEKAREAAGEDGREAAAETEEALRTLERGLEDLEFLPEALSASQGEQAERTDRVRRGLETLAQGETETGHRAARSLEKAAGAMRDASESSRRGQPPDAAREAAEAAQALEEALEALDEARADAAQKITESAADMARTQRELAEEAQRLGRTAGDASMDAESREAVEENLAGAQQAMEQAAEELSQGRSASAAGSQRKAMEALQEAGRRAQEGVTPSDEEDRAKAEELAREQERIRQEMLDLARRAEERKNAQELPSLDRAAQAAQQAQKALDEGDLSEAERQEERAEQELRRAQQELEEEEQQYQSLRQEEQLFRIVEEARGIRATHQEQMAAVREIDAQREPASSLRRSLKIQLRRIATTEEGLATRSGEIAQAIEDENSLVTAQLMRNVEDDLLRVTDLLGEVGDYETGELVQGLMRDVDEALGWLLEALREEQSRRQQQDRQQQQQQQQQGQNEPEPLVPDSAELKLVRRMVIDGQDFLQKMRKLYPELEGGEVDPLVLEEITRLALRGQRVTELFRAMRERIGIPAPPPEDE